MKKTAVIVAGGSGQRMGAAVPKQFLELRGKPVLWYTLESFLAAFEDMEIVLVLPGQHLQRGKEIAESFSARKIRFAVGGATRFDSVRAGLALAEPGVVFVHDAVRCLITPQLIQQCYYQTLEKGSAVPAVKATDSIRIVTGDTHATADRERVRLVQTPQTFLTELLLPAFDQPYQPSFTDEATVAEAAGCAVFLIEGDYDNIKITRPVDMVIAEQIMDARASIQS